MAESDQQSSNDFFSQFLDDYFVESDEHLAIVKLRLLDLERFVNNPIGETSLVDELLRSFHTIKGISGMVGFSSVEQLAHELEGYLRVLQQKSLKLMPEGFDALIEGTRSLEHLIESHRKHQALPDISNQIGLLANLAANASTGWSTLPPQQEPALAHRAEPAVFEHEPDLKREWHFIFAPTPALSETGINVNTVRARLLEVGQILRSAPLIESGGVAFEFIVQSDMDDSDLDSLTSLGLSIVPVVRDESEVTPVRANVGVDNGSPSSAIAASSSVRVDLDRLNQLMLIVSDLLISRARLENTLKTLKPSLPASGWRMLQEVSGALNKQLRDLRAGVMRVRMVPLAEIFERMRFVVRDLARESGKSVQIELRGKETKIDKYLVERLMDPLLHLVRNAISHGIETAEERLKFRKSPEGRVVLSAQADGDMVVIEIADDGRGIALAEIETHFPKAKLQNERGEVDSNGLLDILCAPGFSTRREADRASGRGVGMDIVRNAIRALDGELSLETIPGEGTKFRITLPLTLAIADAVIATVGSQTFAIHRSSIEEIVEIEPGSVKVLENNEIMLHRDNVLPLVRLANIFHIAVEEESSRYAFIVGSGTRATGLVVDKVLGLREVVIRALSDPLTNIAGIAGATELGDGRPILMLDTLEILNSIKPTLVASRN